MDKLPRYDIAQSYDWNYANAPAEAPDIDVPPFPGQWDFCGIPVDSPLGVPAGRLLNSAIADGVGGGLGIGQAVGRFLRARQPPFASGKDPTTSQSRVRIPSRDPCADAPDKVRPAG